MRGSFRSALGAWSVPASLALIPRSKQFCTCESEGANNFKSEPSRTAKLLNLLERRANNLGVASGLKLLYETPDVQQVAEAFWRLLDFRELVETLPKPTVASLNQDHSITDATNVTDHLGQSAANLFDEFVQAALAHGGVPESWASIARNLLASDYAFALFSRADAKVVRQQLLKLKIETVYDPMAGTGLHGRMLAQEGLQVFCSDIVPGGAGRICWYPVQSSCCESEVGEGRGALFMSWPPRSEAATVALRRTPCDVLILVADSGSWHGSLSFHEELQENWDELFRHEILCWPRMADKLRILQRKDKTEKQGRWHQNFCNKSDCICESLDCLL